MKTLKFLGVLRARCAQYVSDYSLVLSHPKTFNDYRAANISSSIARANYFLAISLVLGIGLSCLLLLPAEFHWEFTVGRIVLDLIEVILSALVLRASWFVVGGRAPLKSLFLVLSYHFGVLFVWSTVILWISDIVFRIFDPALHAKLRMVGEDGLTLSEIESPAYLGSIGVLVVGLLGMFAWWIVAWGTYRKLYGLSRTRSVFAFLISCVLFVLISLAALEFESALLPPKYHY